MFKAEQNSRNTQHIHSQGGRETSASALLCAVCAKADGKGWCIRLAQQSPPCIASLSILPATHNPTLGPFHLLLLILWKLKKTTPLAKMGWNSEVMETPVTEGQFLLPCACIRSFLLFGFCLMPFPCLFNSGLPAPASHFVANSTPLLVMNQNVLFSRSLFF